MKIFFKNFKKILNLSSFYQKRYIDYFICALSIILGFYLGWEIEIIAFYVFVVWFILNPVSSKLTGKLAVGSIVLTLLLLIINRVEQAEQFALLGFYFFVFNIISTLREKT